MGRAASIQGPELSWSPKELVPILGRGRTWNEIPPAQLSNGGGDEGDSDSRGAGGLRQVAQLTAFPLGKAGHDCRLA